MIEQTNNLVSEIETYASLMFTRAEIAIILEVDERELGILIKEPDQPVGQAFHRGRLKREAEVRKGIFDLAQNGSSPAQAFAMKLIENAKMDDL